MNTADGAACEEPPREREEGAYSQQIRHAPHRQGKWFKGKRCIMRFKEGIARLPVRAAMIQAGRAPWSDSVAIIFFYESEGARSAGRMSAISEETSAHLDRKSTRREESLTFSKERERASLFGKYLPPSCRRVGLQKAFIGIASQCPSVRYVSVIIRIIRRRCVV